MVNFTHRIPGYFKPYVRVGRERWTPRAKEYFESKDILAAEFKCAALEQGWYIRPKGVLLRVELEVHRPRVFVSDIDNLAKAVLDAANGILFADDRWVTELLATKTRAKPEEAFTLIKIMEV